VIGNFTLVYHNGTQVPTSWRVAFENQTLYVRSKSLISVRSKIIDAGSGLAAGNVSVKITTIDASEKLVYGGPVRHDIPVDLGRFLLSHATIYSITLEAADLAGNLASAHAFIHIDDTAPTTGLVLDDVDKIQVQCHGSSRVICVGWSPHVDSESTVLFYEVAVATKLDKEHDLLAFGSKIESLLAYVELNGTSSALLRPGDSIFVFVKATNAAGLSSLAVSRALTISCATHQCQCSQDIVCV